MKKSEFIAIVRKHAAKHKIELQLRNTNRVVSEGTLVSGVFDHDEKFLKVAIKNPGWFPIFVHEFGHLMQWAEKAPIWTTYIAREALCQKLFDKTAKMRPHTLQYAYEANRNLELDCEKRTVALIKKYKLPINIESYIQNANAYIFFYTMLRDTRTWYSKKQPYRVKQILDLMPTKFLKPEQYEKLPIGYEALVRRFCLAKGD